MFESDLTQYVRHRSVIRRLPVQYIPALPATSYFKRDTVPLLGPLVDIRVSYNRKKKLPLLQKK
jgi:hypothetical protein